MINVVSNTLHDFLLILKDFLRYFFRFDVLNGISRYLLPGLLIGVCISILFIAIKIISKVIWGK